MMAERASRLGWVVLLSAASLTGCGEQKKIKECNALVSVINAGVEKIQKGTSPSPDAGTAVADLRALAEEMDGIAGEAGKLEPTLPDLQNLNKDYQGMAAEVAAAARDLANAVDNVDVEKMSKAQERMDQAVKREDPIIDAINKFCQTP
jgi:hypothetical protein